MENETQSSLRKTEKSMANTIDDDRGSIVMNGVIKVSPLPTASEKVAKRVTDKVEQNSVTDDSSDPVEDQTSSELNHNIINVKPNDVKTGNNSSHSLNKETIRVNGDETITIVKTGNNSTNSLNKDTNRVVNKDETSVVKATEPDPEIKDPVDVVAALIPVKKECIDPNDNETQGNVDSGDESNEEPEPKRKMDPEYDTKHDLESNSTREMEKQKSEKKETRGDLKIDIEKAVFYIGDEQNVALSPKSPRPSIFGNFRLGQRDSLMPNGTENRRHSILQNVQSVLSMTKKKKEKVSPEIPPPEFIPPDGGYGWIVVLAACVVNMWIVGFIKSYSVLYVEIIAAYPGSSAYHASWIPALLSTIGLLVAPLTGVLCREFTSRKVSAFGGFLCFLGIFLSAFATSLTHLIFTIGVITGLGAGLTQTPGILIVSLYFCKRRSLASAICVSGNAIGSFFMPPLIDFLLSEYRLKGTLLIVAALQLNIVAASLLYRPIGEHAQVQARQRAKLAARGGYEKSIQNGDGGFDFNAESKFSRTRSGSILERVLSSKILAGEESELTREISFLRSTSMMTSVPDLGQYARSWSVSSANLKTTLTQQQQFAAQQAAVRRRSNRKLTVSESGDGRPPNGSTSEVPSRGMPKTLSAIMPTRPSHRPTSMRRASTQSKMAFERQFSIQRRQSDLSSLREMQLGSCLSLVPSEEPIREEDEDLLEDLMDTQAQRYNEESKTLLEPIRTLTKQVEEDNKQRNLSADSLLIPRDGKYDQHSIAMTEKHTEKVQNAKWIKIKQAMSSCFDVEVLKTRKMILMSVSISLVAMGAPHSLFYLHAYAKSVDIDLNSVTTLLSISALVDLVGRLGVGVVADMNIINTAYIYFFSAGLAGVSVFCLTWTHSFWGMAVLLSLYGFGIGSWFVLMPTILAHDHGIAKLAASFGFVRFCMGCINFVSPQVCGVLVDLTGGYGAVYYFMGTCMFLAALLVLLGQWMPLEEKTKEKEEQLA